MARNTQGRNKLKGKLKTLAQAIAAIERQFGQGAAKQLNHTAELRPMTVIPTGSTALDCALGVGGYPRGCITEIFGSASSGKTTLTLHAIAQVQSRGGVAAFIDAEHTFDAQYARKLGVRVEELLISQPDSGEQALGITELLVHSPGVDLIVIDSISALIPQAEIEGSAGDRHVGAQARLTHQALRKLTVAMRRSGTSILCISQTRMKRGVVFGNAETTAGGHALRFHASVRCEIRRTAHLKDGGALVGLRAKVKVMKNKVAPPFHEAEFTSSTNEPRRRGA